MDKKTFALEQVVPYFKDLSTLAYNEQSHTLADGNGCSYLMDDGRMCVAGKNLLPEVREKYKDKMISIVSIIENEGGQEFVFPTEIVDVLEAMEWKSLQGIHDNLAQRRPIDVMRHIDDLKLFTVEELNEKVGFDVKEIFA